jgi:putative ABC transport system ATP-binding protein
VRALDDVSVEIEQGSFTVVAGNSGSGKSTLLALLGAMERPTRGRILFAGKDLGNCSDAELARARRRMGFVFQDFSLIADLSVEENITYPLIPRRVPRAERRERAQRVLARFGLASNATTRARELSGGEQQRVAIARALACQPEVVLADEPTSNLDSDAGGMVVAMLQQWHAEGVTLIVATHDPRIVALAGRVYELAAGRLKTTTEDRPPASQS